LRAYAEHGELHGAMDTDGGESELMLARFAKAGIDTDALAAQLQREGAQSFVKSWTDLLQRIATKATALEHASP
jgi:transaldolase